MIIFAVMGSALSLQFAKKLNWWQGILTVATGAIIAISAVPAFFEVREIEYSQFVENAASFFTAFFGMAIMAIIFSMFEKLDFASKVNEWIDKKLGI